MASVKENTESLSDAIVNFYQAQQDYQASPGDPDKLATLDNSIVQLGATILPMVKDNPATATLSNVLNFEGNLKTYQQHLNDYEKAVENDDIPSRIHSAGDIAHDVIGAAQTVAGMLGLIAGEAAAEASARLTTAGLFVTGALIVGGALYERFQQMQPGWQQLNKDTYRGLMDQFLLDGGFVEPQSFRWSPIQTNPPTATPVSAGGLSGLNSTSSGYGSGSSASPSVDNPQVGSDTSPSGVGNQSPLSSPGESFPGQGDPGMAGVSPGSEIGGGATNDLGGTWATAQQYMNGQLTGMQPIDERNAPDEFPEGATQTIPYLYGNDPTGTFNNTSSIQKDDGGAVSFVDPSGQLVTNTSGWQTPDGTDASGGNIVLAGGDGGVVGGDGDGGVGGGDGWVGDGSLGDGGAGDGDPGDGSPGDGNVDVAPVILDLTGKGINITPLGSSDHYFDLTGDGYQSRTAWAGLGNGTLVLDLSGQGDINNPLDFEFTKWDPTAKSDMQALEDIFDTNRDGKLDAGDADWSKFGVLVTNPDGTTQFESLSQLGITSIDLATNNNSNVLSDGSEILGTTTYTKSDGSTGTAADVSLAYDANGYLTQTSTTVNSDGSTSIDVKAFNPDGSLANETVSTTSADGLSVTLQFDDSGSGLFDRSQTDVTTNNSDGSRTATISTRDAAGTLLNGSITTTSADGKTVTIDRDLTGSGQIDQTETHLTSADGSSTITISDLNADGTARDRTVVTQSADGLSKSTQTDLSGDGVVDQTVTDTTTVNADGSRTETVSNLSQNNSLERQVITTTSADGLTKTTEYDSAGNQTIDLTEVLAIAVNADGSSVTDQTERNGNNTLREEVVTTLSADGLSKTVQYDLDGNGQIDLTTSDDTVQNSDGSRVETVIDRNGDGSLRDKSVTTIGADGVSRTVSADTNGDDVVDHIESVTRDSSNAIVDTVSNYNADGTLRNQTVTTSNASGSSITTQYNRTGGATFDQTKTDVTSINSDGSSTETVSYTSANGTLEQRTVTTTSAGGLTVVTRINSTGGSTFDDTRTDVTTINSDGSRTETISDRSVDNTLLDQVTTTTSANRLSVTTQIDANGDGHIEQARTTLTASNGTTVSSVSNYSASGSLVNETVATTSADGLSVTTQRDSTGSGTFDNTRTDVTVVNADGSKTETVTDVAASGAVRDIVRTTTSANGLSVKTEENATGRTDGTFDRVTTDNVVINSDGSRTETISDFSAGGTLLDKTVKTTGADGLSVVTQLNSTGGSTFDKTTSDSTVLNSNGSKTETVAAYGGSGVLIGESVTTSSASGQSVSRTVYSGPYSVKLEAETVTVAANGSRIESVQDYNADGSLRDEVVKTTSANGLSVTTQRDTTGSGSFDQTRTDITTIGTDGTTTETITDLNSGSSATDRTVIITSANGLSKTIKWDNSGDGSFDLVETDVVAIGSDGSRVETVTYTGTINEQLVTTTSADRNTVVEQQILDGIVSTKETQVVGNNVITTVSDANSGGSLKDRALTTTSANGLSITTQRDVNGDGTFDETRTDFTSVNADGSRTETVTDYNASGNVTDQAVTTTSENGLRKTTQYDLGGAGSFAESRSDISVINQDGSVTETVTYSGSGGAVLSQFVQTTSANGLQASNQWTNSAGVHQTASDVTTLNADGSRTETVSAYNGSSLLSQTVSTVSADGLSLLIKKDTTGNGTFDQTTSIVDSADQDGSRTEMRTDFDGNGAVLDQEVTKTSADGRTVTITRDANGDATVDQTETIVTAIDGSSVETITDYSAAGAIDDRSVVTTSADGRSVATRWSYSGGQTVDRTRTDVTVVDLDGSRTETITDTNSDGTLHQKSVMTTSADGLTKTLDQDTTGSGYYDVVETTNIQLDESTTTVTKDFNASGTVTLESITTVSADGKTETVLTDSNGPTGVYDKKAVTQTNIDGSQVATTQDFNTDGSVKDRSVTTVSADGLATTIQTDSTNAGWFSSVETDVTRIDGSTLATVIDYSAANTAASKTVTETSADGQDKVSDKINYQDGTSIVSMQDLDKSQSWSFLSDTYNSSGSLLQQQGTYQSGQSWLTVYDVAGTQTWSMESEDFNAAGQLVSAYVLNDDGSYIRNFYDPTGSADWSEVSDYYNAQGSLTDQYGDYDDGVFFSEPSGPVWATGDAPTQFELKSWHNNFTQSDPVPGSFSGTILTDSFTFSSTITPDGTLITPEQPGYGNARTYYISESGGGAAVITAASGAITGSIDIPQNLGSLFDYQRGIISWASNWENLPTNVPLPSDGSELADLIGKTDAAANTSSAAALSPTLSVQSASGYAGAAIRLSIATSVPVTDNRESLSVKIAGLPSAALLSAGTQNSDGSWTLTPLQLAHLVLIAPPGSLSGLVNLTVTSIATEIGGSTASTSATLAISFLARISDTAANVSANIASLSANPYLGSITLTDSGTPTLTLTAGQLAGDLGTLSKITNPAFNITVSDTGAAFTAQAGMIGGGANAGDTWLKISNADGTEASYTVNDLTGAQSYSYTELFNHGVLATEGGTYTSGSYAGDTFLDTYGPTGTVASSVVDDTSNHFSWSSSSSSFDQNGHARATTVVQDTGDVSIYVYDGSGNQLNSGTRLANPTSNGGWISASGEQYIVYYNGSLTNSEVVDITSGSEAGDTEVETFNSSGGLVSEDFNDKAAAAGDSYTEYFSNSGALVSIFGTYDSGSGKLAGDTFGEIYNANGTYATITLNDITGNNGSSYTNSYSSSGVLLSQSGVYDSGVLAGDTYTLTYNTNGSVASYTAKLSASQALGNAAALAQINAAYNIAVVDTAANIATNLTALNATGHLSSITMTDAGAPVLVLTAAQLVADTGKITNASYTTAVSDTAANVSANIAALNASAHLGSITLTDAGTPALTLTSAQLANDLMTLSKISNPAFNITVSDTGATLTAQTGTLTSGTNVGDTWLKLFNADGTVASYTLNDLTGNNSYSYTETFNHGVVATESGTYTSGANVGDTFSETFDPTGAIASFVLNDTAAHYTYSTETEFFDSNGGLRGESLTMRSGYMGEYVYDGSSSPSLLNSGTEVAPTSNSGWITSGNLQYIVYYNGSVADWEAEQYISGVDNGDTVTYIYNASGGYLSMSFNDINRAAGSSYTEYLNSAGTPLSELGTFDSGSASLLVGDTWSETFVNGVRATYTVNDITGNNGSSYTNSYSSSGVLLSQSGVYDSGVLAGDTYTLTYNTNGSVASYTAKLSASQALGNAAALAQINAAYNIAVVDTAANIATNLTALNATGHLSSITMTDAGAPVLVLTAAQLVADTGKITNASYTTAVSDTAANVSANIAALNASAHLGSITLTDAGTPALTLTSAQLANDLMTLSKISNPAFNITVSDTGATLTAQTGTLTSGTNVGDTWLKLFNADGTVASYTLNDLTGNNSYSYTETFNHGVVATESGTYTSGANVGDTFSETFGPTGAIASFVLNDTAAHYTYSTETEFFDSNGGLRGESLTMRSGYMGEYVYDGSSSPSLLNSGTEVAPTSNSGWITSGNLQYIVYYNGSVADWEAEQYISGVDNGDTVTYIYNASGGYLSMSFNDINRAAGSSYTEYLNSAGTPLSELGTFDSGSASLLVGDTWSETFVNGVRATYTVNDITGNNG
ncbi:hypothetical protein JQ616_37630, partial [Bradyrhizobium tropiciagri]|uniref:hypothetical protein n=1 Tax=Bradyrhizobium tropiciagri TaxID=312253 RepID=UPI001BA8D157